MTDEFTTEMLAPADEEQDLWRGQCEPLIEAIERELADGSFQAINPADVVDHDYRFIVEQVHAALAKGGPIDVAHLVRRILVQLRMNELEAEGLIEKTGEMRASPITGELLPAWTASPSVGSPI